MKVSYNEKFPEGSWKDFLLRSSDDYWADENRTMTRKEIRKGLENLNNKATGGLHSQYQNKTGAFTRYT